MYSPKFTISYKILKNIGAIEAAKEVIENAPLVPDFEKEFQSDAIIRTVYHGTHIEGNDLTLSQTKQVIEGEEIYARERDVQEVINYRNVVRLLDDLSNKRGAYDLDSLLEIHKTTVDRIVSPEKSGVLRTTQVIIREEGTGKVILKPPPPHEVPYLLEDFFEWLNSNESAEIHPIIKAGIVHYVLSAVHPFVEGNGRTARAFANLVTLREGYNIKRFFAIEEHFDKDLNRYYEAFFLVDQQSPDIASRDLTPWIEYFTETVAVELNKIKEKVRALSIDSRLKLKIGEQVALSAREVKLIEYLSEHGSGVMKEIREVFPMVSEDTILRDVNDLINKSIIEKEGSTKGSRYIMRTKT
jgi:Fic family protein